MFEAKASPAGLVLLPASRPLRSMKFIFQIARAQIPTSASGNSVTNKPAISHCKPMALVEVTILFAMQVPVGAIIACSFATIWAAAGASRLGRLQFWLAFIAALLISAVIIFVAATITPVHRVVFNLRAYNWSVAFEAILIAAAIAFLRTTDRKDLILPAVSLVVGLHFFGMVWALGSNEYWWVGGAMCVLPILTLFILPQRVWMTVVGLGCATILWISVIWSLFY